MKSGILIKLIREPDDEYDVSGFEISISNGLTCSELKFWEFDDVFKKFGEKLRNFPNKIQDEVIFEVGGKDYGEIRFANYLLLKVYCYERAGETAIKVIIDNHQDEPEYQYCEFSIKIEPALLNKLGEALTHWQPLENREFEWIFSI